MRTRNRVDRPIDGHYSGYQMRWGIDLVPGVGWQWMWVRDEIPNLPFNGYQTYEYMTDDPNPSDRGIKPLNHTTVTMEYNFVPATLRQSYTRYVVIPPSAWFADYLSTWRGSSVATPGSFASDLQNKILDDIAQAGPASVVNDTFLFVKDIREVVQMVRNPLEFLTELVSGKFSAKVARLIGKNPKKKRSLVSVLTELGMKETSGGFLKYSYGWRPLLADIVGTLQATINARDSYQQYLQECKSGVSERRYTKTASTTVSDTVTDESITSYGTYSKTTSKYKARCLLWATVAPSSTVMSYGDFLTARLGLDAPRLLNLAWDAIPYSFVIDWFIPVGNYLNRITNTPMDISISRQQYDYICESESKLYQRDSQPILGGLSCSDVYIAGAKRKSYVRSGSPQFSYDGPSWISNYRAAEALALIAQNFKYPIPK